MENAVLIAVTGSEFVLHWRECGVSETGGPNEYAFRRDSKPGQAGRQTVEKSIGEIKEIDVRELPPVAFLAAGVAVAAVAVGMGWIVYRSRRRAPWCRGCKMRCPKACASCRRAPRPGQASALTRLQSGRGARGWAAG